MELNNAVTLFRFDSDVTLLTKAFNDGKIRPGQQSRPTGFGKPRYAGTLGYRAFPCRES